jgi:hypothetical protein
MGPYVIGSFCVGLSCVGSFCDGSFSDGTLCRGTLKYSVCIIVVLPMVMQLTRYGYGMQPFMIGS